MDRKRRISRVDVQVSIVTAVLVTTALICVYFFNYFITHEDMINSLKERSHSIYQYVDDYVDKTTFQNTEALTRDNPAYIRMKEKLEEVIMRCDSDSGKKLIKSMVLRTADRQGMC